MFHITIHDSKNEAIFYSILKFLGSKGAKSTENQSRKPCREAGENASYTLAKKTVAAVRRKCTSPRVPGIPPTT